MPGSAGHETIAEVGPDDLVDAVAMLASLSRQQGDPHHHFDLAAARRDLLGDPPFLSAAIARWGSAPAGIAAWHLSYETAYAARGAFITALWVEPAFRRRGVATRLVAEVARRAAAVGGVYLWWASKPWNKEAHATYQALGAGSEPVIAHALIGDAFRAAARSD